MATKIVSFLNVRLYMCLRVPSFGGGEKSSGKIARCIVMLIGWVSISQ
jgi:hypothetical protein